MSPRGLLIFPRPGDHYRQDFATITDHLRRIAPELRVKIAHEPQPPADFGAEFRDLPTLVVSFRHGVPVPVPGRVFSCRVVLKPEQLRCYAKAGIPFPRARLFQWGVELDPALWGPFVVMKPIDPHGSSLGLVQLLPTGLVPRLKPQHFDPLHPIHHSPLLLQAFIDTGANPSHYRVLSLFGEPLYSRHAILKQARPPLTAPLLELLAAKVASGVGERNFIMTADPELLAFARRMWHALPDVPLQGLDIVKEQSTGRLFAIESNPGGNTWHFSSRRGAASVAQMVDGLELMLNQFGALERSAEALARAAELYAA